MLSGTFVSRYAEPIFSKIEKALKMKQVTIIKDPVYLNNKGQYRFLMTASSPESYKDAYDTIANMIGNYLHGENKKLIENRNPKAPEPLNIII
tara:strand:+ start:223 stop:501 length:279 start_codon:yes stop_codon:yes gene_type:complete